MNPWGWSKGIRFSLGKIKDGGEYPAMSSSASFPENKVHFLAQCGQKLFPFRLLLGVVVAVGALEWLTPAPFFSAGHRISHALALLVIGSGLGLRAWGTGSAGGHTRSATIEAFRLATGGPFAYLRNPIYVGSIGIGIGMSLLIGDPLAFLVTAIVFVLLYLVIIPAEEEFLLGQFGDVYLRYQAAVPRLIPRLRPWPDHSPNVFQWKAVLGECGILLLLLVIYSLLLFEEHLDQVGW